MDQETTEKIKAAALLIADAQWPIALTGAGISVDSGIPDFRSPGGLWTRFDPFEYATIQAFRADPKKVWEMLTELSALIIEAAPNPGHTGFSTLEKMGRLKAVITQNVDNLHQEAGNREVIEFHGNGNLLVCLNCGYKVDAKTGEDHAKSVGDWPPDCPQCGEILKPGVVFFGEEIPSDPLHKAHFHAARADLIIVVGTSATVAPASGIPLITKQGGGKILEINLAPTQLTALADITIIGGASRIMPLLVDEVEQLLRKKQGN